MKDLTIGIRLDNRTAPEAVEGAVAAERAGIDVAWSTSGGVAPDPLVSFGAAAGQTERIHFGTCIIPTFPRHPLALAQSVIAVNGLAPGRMRLGVGPSHEPSIKGTYALDFTRPLEHLREYVTILKTLFRDGKVEFRGKRLTAVAQIAEPADVPVMVSALRHNAFRLAGEVADGGISWVSPLPHIANVAAPALREGAEVAGRPAPPAIVHTPVVISTDREAVIEAALKQFGFYARLPFYSAMWQEAGFPEAAGGETSDAMVDALVLSGDEDTVAERLRAFPANGAGEIIADVINLPGDPAARERTIAFLGRMATNN